MVSITRNSISINNSCIQCRKPRKKVQAYRRKSNIENAKYDIFADVERTLEKHWKSLIGFHVAFWGGGYVLAYVIFVLSH